MCSFIQAVATSNLPIVVSAKKSLREGSKNKFDLRMNADQKYYMRVVLRPGVYKLVFDDNSKKTVKIDCKSLAVMIGLNEGENLSYDENGEFSIHNPLRIHIDEC